MALAACFVELISKVADFKVERVDPASYAKFLSDNLPDNPYSLLPLLEAYRDAFSSEFELLFIARSGIPVASAALFVGKKFGQPTVRIMPMRIYDGVHLRKLEDSKFQKQEHEKLSALQALEEYLENNFSFHQISLPPSFFDIRSFQWSGARVVPQYTYIVDLLTFSTENYTKSLKEILRSAENSGLSAGACSVSELVALQQISYERHSRQPPVLPDKLNGLLNALHSAGLLDIKCVRNRNGNAVAALSWLRMNLDSFFYVAGTDAEAEKGASHFLYHEILKTEKELGKRSVDFCGANTPSINLFKSAFGPRLEIYFKIWRANRLMTRVASLFKKF